MPVTPSFNIPLRRCTSATQLNWSSQASHHASLASRTNLALGLMFVRGAALLALSILPLSAFCQTLCKKRETDYFSCVASGSKKVISVCGKISDDPDARKSWIQYRFGRIGQIESAYPSIREGSLSEFEGIYFNRYGVLSFDSFTKKLSTISASHLRQVMPKTLAMNTRQMPT